MIGNLFLVLFCALLSASAMSRSNLAVKEFKHIAVDVHGQSQYIEFFVPANTRSFGLQVFNRSDISVIEIVNPDGKSILSEAPENVDLQKTPWMLIDNPGLMASQNRAFPTYIKGYDGHLIPNNPSVKMKSGTWRFKVKTASQSSFDAKIIFKGKTAALKIPVRFLLPNFLDHYGIPWSKDLISENESFAVMLRSTRKVFESAGFEMEILSTETLGSDWVGPANSFGTIISELNTLLNQTSLNDDAINVIFTEDLAASGISIGLPGPYLTGSHIRSAVIISVQAQLSVGAEGLGLILAHEICHYLGIGHTYTPVLREYILEDQLSDTDAHDENNLMYPLQPGFTLSPQQIEILKGHPLISE